MEGFRVSFDDVTTSPTNLSVLNDLLNCYDVELDEGTSSDDYDDEIGTTNNSFKYNQDHDTSRFTVYSSMDDYNRYVEEFESIVNKRNELQQSDGSFLTTIIESKQEFDFGEEFEEAKKFLDEDDFVENYLSTVKELKHSLTNAVEDMIQIVPKIPSSTVIQKSAETILPRIEKHATNYRPSPNSIDLSKTEIIDQSEVLKKKFEEEEKAREEERRRRDIEYREKQRKLVEEKRRKEEEELVQNERYKKELEMQELLFKEQQVAIERQIAEAHKKQEVELQKEMEQQELLRKLVIKKKEEQRQKEEQEKLKMEAEKQEKAIERKNKIEYNKKVKEERRMLEEKIRKEQELKRIEEEKRKQQEEHDRVKREVEKKRIEEERNEKERLKIMKRQYISKTVAELFENSRRSKCWTLFQDLERWRVTIKKFSKGPPPPAVPASSFSKESPTNNLSKPLFILDEEKLENNMPFEKDNLSVTHINIRGEDVSTIKDKVFEPFVNLRALILDTNALHSIGPLKDTLNLECLSLNDNRLTNIQLSREISSKLKELYALGNNIASLTSMRNTCQLRGINLCNNKIQDLNGLQNNRNLQYIRVDINKISDLKILDAFSNLQYLDCGFNELESLQNSLRFNLLLEDLILYQNRISQLPSFHHVLLKSLYLNTNQIVQLPNQFLFSPLLQYLNLSGNKIEHLSPLTNCIMLRNINLSFNNIQYVDELLHLKYCRNVEEIKINDNPLCRGGVLFRELLIGILPNLISLDGECVSPNSRFNIVSHIVHYSPRLVGHLVSFINHSLKICVPSIEGKQLRENYYKFMRDAITLDKSQRSLQALPTTVWNTKTTYYYMCSRQVIERSHFNNYHQCLSSERFNDKNFNQVQQRFSKRLDNRLAQYEQKSEQKSKHFEEHFNYNPNNHQNYFSLNSEYQERMTKIKSASLIQRWFRCWKIKNRKQHEILRHEAAIKIQKIWRGYISRKFNLPWILTALHTRHVAATKIQSVWKGYRVRTILKKARQFEDDEIFELENAIDDFDYPSKMLATDVIDVKISEKRRNRKFDVYYYDVNTKTSHGGNESIKEQFLPSQHTTSTHKVKNQNWIQPATTTTTIVEEEEDQVLINNNNTSICTTSDSESVDNDESTSVEKSSQKLQSSMEALKNSWHFTNPETVKDLFAKNLRMQQMKNRKKQQILMKDPMKRLEKFKKSSAPTQKPATKPKINNNKQNLVTHTANLLDSDMDLRSISSSRSTDSVENLRLPKINNRTKK